MPPSRKIEKEDIIKGCMEILNKESIENLNARRIARELGCSVQPIFYNFENMDELKKEVILKINQLYQSYMIIGSKSEVSYRGMGLAYIKFAREYPNYFKLLFMTDTGATPEFIIDEDNKGNHVIEAGMKLTGFTYEQQRDFHIKVWIYTHGIATLIATGTVNIEEKEVEKLLIEGVRNMIAGIKKG